MHNRNLSHYVELSSYLTINLNLGIQWADFQCSYFAAAFNYSNNFVLFL